MTDRDLLKKAAMRRRFEAIGRDLFYKLECSCLDPAFSDSSVAHLFKRKVRLTGYADDNFFDRANAHPNRGKCVCGRAYTYQWFRDGIDINWDDTAAPLKEES